MPHRSGGSWHDLRSFQVLLEVQQLCIFIDIPPVFTDWLGSCRPSNTKLIYCEFWGHVKFIHFSFLLNICCQHIKMCRWPSAFTSSIHFIIPYLITQLWSWKDTTDLGRFLLILGVFKSLVCVQSSPVCPPLRPVRPGGCLYVHEPAPAPRFFLFKGSYICLFGGGGSASGLGYLGTDIFDCHSYFVHKAELNKVELPPQKAAGFARGQKSVHTSCNQNRPDSTGFSVLPGRKRLSVVHLVGLKIIIYKDKNIERQTIIFSLYFHQCIKKQ